jgi:phosphohistidine phosphatase
LSGKTLLAAGSGLLCYIDKMLLFVMRHGIAEDQSASGVDGDRALTLDGRHGVRRVAHALKTFGEVPVRIVSSPLVRALQTAELTAAALDRPDAVAIARELALGGRTAKIARSVVLAADTNVMLVGHEPDLGDFVSELAGPILSEGFLKAMVVGFMVRPDAAHPRGYTASPAFVLHPKTLGIRTEFDT